MKKKILIIGGTGFIGYHLAKQCLKLNWEVTTLSLQKPKKIERIKKIKYLIFDFRKFKNLKKIIKKNYNYVVNLGGYVDHANKTKTFRSHYLGVKNLCNIFLKKNINSFIQVGSSAEYGNIKSPHKESDECKPKLIYGRSKLLATNFLINIYLKYNFPVTIIRYYQVYGPNQKFDRFIPILIKACIKKNKFDCSDGQQSRDFLYVTDAVDAIIKSIKSKKSKGKIINIGTGKPVKLKKIINHLVKRLNGGEPQFGKIKLRTDEAKIIYPNLFNAKNLINWSPKVSFVNGMNKTIRSYLIN